MLFPEMDATADVAEITTACWDVLGKHPADVMEQLHSAILTLAKDREQALKILDEEFDDWHRWDTGVTAVIQSAGNGVD